MRWSKLKKNIESNFAESVKGRINIFATRYTIASFFMVRAWITIDKIEVANFSTVDNYNRFEWDAPEINKRITLDERNLENIVEKGEFSRIDFLDACWSFTNLSIEESLLSDNPIIKSLAMIDKRLGKRRLKIIEKDELHPLVLKLFNLRIECESKFALNKYVNIEN